MTLGNAKNELLTLAGDNEGCEATPSIKASSIYIRDIKLQHVSCPAVPLAPMRFSLMASIMLFTTSTIASPTLAQRDTPAYATVSSESTTNSREEATMHVEDHPSSNGLALKLNGDTEARVADTRSSESDPARNYKGEQFTQSFINTLWANQTSTSSKHSASAPVEQLLLQFISYLMLGHASMSYKRTFDAHLDWFFKELKFIYSDLYVSCVRHRSLKDAKD
ncbi:hypothetical protein D9757_005944 [Collybiopsis confluens]|uniref:Uncharacterized protein n=1 Tax=Collybiopsis confluens TaxID=2823264 RepID=A0A8H5HNR3_9AGAR|nr:hypothetical protein D9757_005944 [Collybiopsis confluens]